MPDYRQGTVKGGGQFKALSKFINVKRSFDDAVRKHQWEQESKAMASRQDTAGELKRIGAQQGSYTPTNEDLNPMSAGQMASGGVPSMPSPQWQPSAAKLSPAIQNAKDKRTEKFLTDIESNNSSRESIKEAMDAAEKISSGIYGKVGRNWAKNLNPDNPGLGEWQKIKIVLLDATLMNLARTKGAVSDAEMKEFQNAAANDDLASFSRMKPVFKRLMNAVNDSERGQAKSYQKIYGEDPYGFTSSNIQDFENLFGQKSGTTKSNQVGKYSFE